MSTQKDILVFTYTDKKYDFFAIPYAYFVLRNNNNALVEICFEDYNSFYSENVDNIKILNKIYPNRVLFRQSEIVEKYKGIIPNTVRFVEQAKLKAKYLYIGDIDLLIFDDIKKIHLTLMKENNIPFSNIIRLNTLKTTRPRLSGLHFVHYNDYYPLPNLDDFDLKIENDEFILYVCMTRKGIMVPESFQIRPSCGIHMSLSRDPLGRTTGAVSGMYSLSNASGWNIGGGEYCKLFLTQIKEKNFMALLPLLSITFRQLLIIAEAFILKQHRLLHRLTVGYCLDRRLLINKEHIDKKGFYELRDKLLKEKNYGLALDLGNESVLIWPFDIDIWYKQAWLYMVLNKIAESIEAMYHIFDLPKGKDFMLKNNFIKSNSEKIRQCNEDGKKLVEIFNDIAAKNNDEYGGG